MRISRPTRAIILAFESTSGETWIFAQPLKLYAKPDSAGPDWYGPAKVFETAPTPVTGEPDEAHNCTSHVEGSDLNFRMYLREFTRLVNAFGKKLANLKAAVALFVAWYNFCRVHMTLRVAPGMEARIADYILTVEELLSFSRWVTASLSEKRTDYYGTNVDFRFENTLPM